MRSSRLMLAVLVVGLLTSPLWTPDYVKERLASTQTEADGSDEVMLDPGAQSRVNTWQTLITIIQEHPLDGVGFDALGHLLPEAGEELGLRVKDSSHNTYLRMLAELGLFGLLALLWLMWRCFRLCEAARHAATERFDRQLAVGASAALLTLVVSCWFGDRFFNVMVTGSFWILCALLDDVVAGRRGEPA
jgi:O-antigen ligase